MLQRASWYAPCWMATREISAPHASAEIPEGRSKLYTVLEAHFLDFLFACWKSAKIVWVRIHHQNCRAILRTVTIDGCIAQCSCMLSSKVNLVSAQRTCHCHCFSPVCRTCVAYVDYLFFFEDQPLSRLLGVCFCFFFLCMFKLHSSLKCLCLFECPTNVTLYFSWKWQTGQLGADRDSACHQFARLS